MRIIRFAIDRPVSVLMIFTAVFLFGLVSVGRLPLNLLPDVSYPTLTLQTEYTDAAPAEVENLVTRPLEEAVGVVPGLKRIRSVSRPGFSEITLEFGWENDMDYASLDVREKVDQVELPRECGPPILLRFDPALDPIMRIGVYGEEQEKEETADGVVAGLTSEASEPLIRLRFLAEQILKKQLEPVEGVASAKVQGGLEEEIHVYVDESRLAALGVPISTVTSRLGQENVNLSGGRIRDQNAEFLLRTQNEFGSVDEIAQMVLVEEEGRRVELGDVARVVRGYKDQEIITRIEGREAVELSIFKEGDANTVAVADRVRRRLQNMTATLPEGIHSRILFDQSGFIKDAIGEVRSNALLGGILAILVLYAFLRDFRSTLTIGLSIPLSVLATFIFMGQLGVSLNLMSLGGLALGIGMLVDNSIVVLESISRHRARGADRKEATFRGGTEVGRAVIASTLTTVAVFLPIIFVEGMAGQFFRDQALTVSASLLASLVVALLLIPMISSWSRSTDRSGPPPVLGTEALKGSDPLRTNGGLDEDPDGPAPPLGRLEGSAYRLLYGLVVGLTWPPRMAARGLGALFRVLRLNVVFRYAGRGVRAAARGIGTVLRAFLLVLARLAYLGLRLARRVFQVVAFPFTFFMRVVFVQGMEAGYPHLLRWSLRHRAAVLVLVLAALGGTLTLIPRLGRELVPPFAQGEFTFNVKLPEGSPLSRTDAVVSRMEEDLEQDPRVETYFANIGTSERSGSAALDKEEHRAQVHVVLEHQLSLKGEDRVVESLRRRFAEIPGMEFDFERPSTFTFTTPIEVEIYGHDLVELREAAARVTRRLERVDGLRDVHSSVVEGNPEIRIVFDRDRIARLGLDLGTISETLRNKVRGDVATRFREYDRQIDIRVRSYDPATSRLRDVENLVVGHVDGIPITLPNVAEIQAERGPSQIERRSQQRAAVVSANIAGRDLGSVSREIEAALREVPLPATFSAVLSGQNKELQSSFSGLFFAIALAVFLVYLVMASQFESLVHPFLIMFTVPLALIGVLVTLALAGQRLSVVVLLGCIVLAGIVVNNGIVLIDYINQLRRRGMPRDEAITTAGHTRLRPIVMTTLTTVLALLPMAMGLGEGAEIRTPMAFTVIGGLLVSTLLTLVVIPVLYSLVDRRP